MRASAGRFQRASMARLWRATRVERVLDRGAFGDLAGRLAGAQPAMEVPHNAAAGHDTPRTHTRTDGVRVALGLHQHPGGARLPSVAGSRAGIGSELQTAYLHRLGLDAEAPSVEALQRLHRRHVERIPYETMWLHAGEAWGIDPGESVTRIARQSRGGYCYHLNGAFAELLRSLGYLVVRHVGGVHGPGGPDPESSGNHLVLTVRGMPSDGNSSGTWYVDVGLGDALHEALPLAAGDYEQAPFHLALDQVEGGTGDWHLTHDPAGGFVGMSWTTAAAEMIAFTTKHEWLSTSPRSPFLQIAMAEHRDATGVDVIRGLVLTRIGDNAATSEPVTNRSEWFGVLADVFDLRFDASSPEAIDHLWDRVVATHRAWDAAGRP
jgi:N-hydroxyarylamine O-acetyltransferase